jgi:hypothetical protein
MAPPADERRHRSGMQAEPETSRCSSSTSAISDALG